MSKQKKKEACYETYCIKGKNTFNIQFLKNPRPEQQKIHELFHKAIDENRETNMKRLNEIFLEYNHKQIDLLLDEDDKPSSDKTASLFVFQGSENEEKGFLETMDFINKRVIQGTCLYGEGTYHTSDFTECFNDYARTGTFLSVMEIKIKKDDVHWIAVEKELSVNQRLRFLDENAQRGPLPQGKKFRILPKPDSLQLKNFSGRDDFWIIASPDNKDGEATSTSFEKATPIYVFEVNKRITERLAALKTTFLKLIRGETDAELINTFITAHVSPFIDKLQSIAQNSNNEEKLNILENHKQEITVGCQDVDENYIPNQLFFLVCQGPSSSILADICDELVYPDLKEMPLL